MEEVKEIKSCRDCKYCVLTHMQTNGSSTYSDFKCVFHGTPRYPLISELQDDKEIPNWCPLESNSKVCEKKYEDMSYYEKQTFWEGIPPMVKWEDIKVSEEYHVPRYHGQGRMDIRIVTKTGTYLQYKKIGSTDAYAYTIYPSSTVAKHMVKKHVLSEK